MMDANTKLQLQAGVKFGLDLVERLPKDDRTVLEGHLCGVLVVFWGALWGTFGTEYAQEFIESQMRAMRRDAPRETFTKPSTH